MRSQTETQPAGGRSIVRSRQTSAAGYLSLTKPGLTGMSVGTAVAGAILAAEGWQDYGRIVAVAVGTFLVGGGAVALNQYAERAFDALMHRTRRRPLPAGTLTPNQGLVFGLGIALLGLLTLATFTTTLAASLAGGTITIYLLVYTPLKRKTHLATAVGGIPGAIPPVIGWVAITGSISIEAYVLFLVLFLWQMPHFLALGWMYREDYMRGGYRLLTSLDATGKITSRIILVFLWALLPASMLPFFLGMAGSTFLAGVFLGWILFVIPSYRFLADVTEKHARAVFLVSLAYIPLFFGLFALDRLLLYL